MMSNDKVSSLLLMSFTRYFHIFINFSRKNLDHNSRESGAEAEAMKEAAQKNLAKLVIMDLIVLHAARSMQIEMMQVLRPVVTIRTPQRRDIIDSN